MNNELEIKRRRYRSWHNLTTCFRDSGLEGPGDSTSIVIQDSQGLVRDSNWRAYEFRLEALLFETPLPGETNIVDSDNTDTSKEIHSTSQVLCLPFLMCYCVHEAST
jgi:hypothetical protein